jgi:GxxExxY protein
MMMISQEYLNKLTYEIIGCAIEVHKRLGPGPIESIYQRCFAKELSLKGIGYTEQAIVPVTYKGLYLNTDLRIDVLVEDVLVVELKAIDQFAPIHEAVLLSYMKLLEKPKGILINFNCTNIFKEGQKTLVNEYFAALPKFN